MDKNLAPKVVSKAIGSGDFLPEWVPTLLFRWGKSPNKPLHIRGGDVTVGYILQQLFRHRDSDKQEWRPIPFEGDEV